MTVYGVPGLCGLELWRGLAGGVPLYQLRERRPEYFQGLREFLVRVHHGNAFAADARETEKLKQAAGFKRLVLCGGDAQDPALEAVLHARPLPFVAEIDTSGPYAATRGALHLFALHGWQRGVALDLGQTQLKVITASHRLLVPRDMLQLPFGAQALDSATGRARLREMLGEGLSRVSEQEGVRRGSPDGIVLALPVALDRNGVAEPATYPGLFGPVQPIFAGLFPSPCLVLNDAVLAGVGFPPRAGEKTLVVTLGFGVGGALWAGGPCSGEAD